MLQVRFWQNARADTLFENAVLADDGQRGFGAWGSTLGRHPGTITAAPLL